jgi:uncharacterized protein YeaO (DUF488 family)
MPRIGIKRAYEEPARADGARVLVDGMWPRGVKKEDLKVEEWMRDLAPSAGLRKWFGHDPERWDEFRHRYFAELDERPESWRKLAEMARKGKVTLVYSARDEQHNNAVALKEYLEARMGRSGGARG